MTGRQEGRQVSRQTDRQIDCDGGRTNNISSLKKKDSLKKLIKSLRNESFLILQKKTRKRKQKMTANIKDTESISS